MSWAEGLKLLATGCEVGGVIRNQDTAKGFKFLGCIKLMIIDVFAVTLKPGKNHHRPARLDRTIDATDACVAYHAIRGCENSFEIILVEHIDIFHVCWFVFSGADLRENFVLDLARSHRFIDCLYKPVEAKQGSNSQKEHFANEKRVCAKTWKPPLGVSTRRVQLSGKRAIE